MPCDPWLLHLIPFVDGRNGPEGLSIIAIRNETSAGQHELRSAVFLQVLCNPSPIESKFVFEYQLIFPLCINRFTMDSSIPLISLDFP